MDSADGPGQANRKGTPSSKGVPHSLSMDNFQGQSNRKGLTAPPSHGTSMPDLSAAKRK